VTTTLILTEQHALSIFIDLVKKTHFTVGFYYINSSRWCSKNL